MYEQHASMEHDKTKFNTKTTVNTSKAFVPLEKDIPEIEKYPLELSQVQFRRRGAISRDIWNYQLSSCFP